MYLAGLRESLSKEEGKSCLFFSIPLIHHSWTFIQVFKTGLSLTTYNRMKQTQTEYKWANNPTNPPKLITWTIIPTGLHTPQQLDPLQSDKNLTKRLPNLLTYPANCMR
jgi:hypothetical protein